MTDNERKALSICLTNYNPNKTFDWHIKQLIQDTAHKHDIYVWDVMIELETEDLIEIMRAIAEETK